MPDTPLLPLLTLPNDEVTPFTLPSEPHNNSSLLLFDDVSPPRSPSPETPDDIDPDCCSDPQLQRLYDMRRLSQAAVRSAKQTEKQMMQVGELQQSAEARRQRKKEKERFKEVSLLLRLKLDAASGKNVVYQMASLVANMFLRRHEAAKPLANLPLVRRSTSHPPSPLSQSFTLDDDS